MVKDRLSNSNSRTHKRPLPQPDHLLQAMSQHHNHSSNSQHLLHQPPNLLDSRLPNSTLIPCLAR
jgi:hypothetical protein